MSKSSKSADWQAAVADILSRLDLRAEYAALGLDITGSQPNGAGWLECRCYGQDDSDPSAGVNVAGQPPALGRYKEFSGLCRNLSFFDFCAMAGAAPSFEAAVAAFAKKTGVKLPQPPRAPDQELAWRTDWGESQWNESLFSLLSWKKGGVYTDEAARRCGGRFAGYPKLTKENSVIAYPVYGPKLLDGGPVNYAMMATNGLEVSMFAGKGKPRRKVKYPVQKEGQPGWIGHWGLARVEKATVLWKVEGLSDLVCLQSVIPPELAESHICFTNSSGAQQTLPDAYFEPFAGKEVYLLHDADRPGELGAAKQSAAFRQAGAKVVRVRLPYEIEDSHGKDLRDWLMEWLADKGETAWSIDLRRQAYHELWKLAKETVPSPQDEAPLDPLLTQKEICEKLEIEVLGERETGEVEVYSLHHKKTRLFKDVDKLGYNRLAQACGPAVKKRVHFGAQDIPGMWRLSEVREAIALLAGYTVITDDNLKGRGVWPVENELGAATGDVVLVGADGSVVWDGEHLRPLPSPRAGRLVLHQPGHGSWFDGQKLAKHLERAQSPEWCDGVIEELTEMLEGWHWKQDEAALAVAGLTLATWIQSLWSWRPQVMVTGDTNTGKSFLFNTLRGVFGDLALAGVGGSTEAGIRQQIGHDSPAVFLDEWDTSKTQQRVLEMVRASSRGDQRLTGTSNQKAVKGRVGQTFWMAGIGDNLQDAADKNRFIMLELLPPQPGAQPLQMRSRPDLLELGQQTLAIAVRHGMAAAELAERLRIYKSPGVNRRIIESFAAPASILATALGGGLPDGERLMGRLLAGVAHHVDEDDSLHMQLLQAIMTAIVDDRAVGKKNVAQLICGALAPGEAGDGPAEVLGRVGLAVRPAAEGDPVGEGSVLVMAFKVVTDALLRRTKWEGMAIDTTLLRLPGAWKSRRRVGGVNGRCVCLGLKSMSRLGFDFSPPASSLF